MIVFAHPAFLLLLPVLFIVLWQAARKQNKSSDLGHVQMLLVHPDLSAVSEKSVAVSGSSRVQWLLHGVALALLVVALSQPQYIGNLIPEKPQGRDIVMLIDTSKTMSIDDFELDNQRVPRLAVLKDVVTRFVAAREGDRFGVIVFGTTAATLVIPSFDRDLVSGMIQQVEVGIAGDNTAIGDAIGLALKQVRERQVLRPALILFSDNTDNTAGELSPSEAVELAKHMGAAIYTVQVGSDLFAEGRVPQKTNQLSEPDMQQIAALTGGRYYRADSSGALQTVIADIGKLEQTITQASTRRRIDEWYSLLLWLAAGLMTLARVLQIRRVAA